MYLSTVVTARYLRTRRLGLLRRREDRRLRRFDCGRDFLCDRRGGMLNTMHGVFLRRRVAVSKRFPERSRHTHTQSEIGGSQKRSTTSHVPD